MFINFKLVVLNFFLGSGEQPERSNLENTVIKERHREVVTSVCLPDFIHFDVRVRLAAESLGEHKFQGFYVKLVDMVRALALFQDQQDSLHI